MNKIKISFFFYKTLLFFVIHFSCENICSVEVTVGFT